MGILRHGGPLLVELLGGCPTPTTRQALGGDRHLKFYEDRDNLHRIGGMSQLITSWLRPLTWLSWSSREPPLHLT
jgi:hypothetical protein